MLNTKLLLCVFVLTLCCKISDAQVHLICCKINQVIPRFDVDNVDSLPKQLLVIKDIVPPLIKSLSKLEIRIITFPAGHQSTKIIKCVNNYFSVEEYDAFYDELDNVPKNVISEYKNYGSLNSKSRNVVLIHKNTNTTNNKSKNDSNELFEILIENHLFDLPTQSNLDKMALQDNPKAADGLVRECCGTYIEIKVDKKCSYIYETSNYSGSKKIAKYTQLKQNIFTVLDEF